VFVNIFQEVGEGGVTEEGECDATFTKICSLPLPENAVVVTGEENEELLLQIRAKLYRLQSLPTKLSSSTTTTSAITVVPIVGSEKKEEIPIDEKEEVVVKQPQSEWVEVGIGPLRVLKKNKDESAVSLIASQVKSIGSPLLFTLLYRMLMQMRVIR